MLQSHFISKTSILEDLLSNLELFIYCLFLEVNMYFKSNLLYLYLCVESSISSQILISLLLNP
ncbi:hypothetical protein VIBNISFn27_590004 [Vibrio nigripulchritudo SFn27]|nr:hypothetical protein VIBNISFn27_590004 [Vibrio nigripulchritudo SFn27]CCO41714.1 hypothetical protein VIBNISFn135_590015 [Vibrio nigripulchritudo SFn135]